MGSITVFLTFIKKQEKDKNRGEGRIREREKQELRARLWKFQRSGDKGRNKEGSEFMSSPMSSEESL